MITDLSLGYYINDVALPRHLYCSLRIISFHYNLTDNIFIRKVRRKHYRFSYILFGLSNH